VAGVSIAVSVLAGALLVGDSVRGSLRRLVLERIGNTVTAVESASLFGENAIAGAPMIVLEGVVTHQSSGRRATQVFVYGVDDRFWKFHGVRAPALGPREAAPTQGLTQELDAKPGDSLLIKLQKPSDIPADSLYGRKEDPAPTLLARTRAPIRREELGEFSLRPQQGSVRAVFVPLTRLQHELGAEGRVNTVLTAGSVSLDSLSLEDLGLRWKGPYLHHASGMMPDPILKAATGAGDVEPVLNYLANAIRIRGREVPYSLVTAMDLAALGVQNAQEDAIVLNDWAAGDLGAKPGDPVEMDFYIWHSDGRLTTEMAKFVLAAVTPILGRAAERESSPDYPGVTDSESVSDWDPPFPLDLKKIRPKDEDYWDKYRTTPKAFVTLARGQALWASRWGNVSALRVNSGNRDGFAKQLRTALRPEANGFLITNVREQGLEASRGATNFGEYFVYFSFFLVVSALLLAGLFFRLGVEQRSEQVGLLRAVGFGPRQVAKQFLAEGTILALLGGAFGVLGSAAYAGLILLGLGTWWVDAVGTRELGLQWRGGSLAAGIAGGALAALATIAWTLRGMRRVSPRALIAGSRGDVDLSGSFRSRAWIVAIIAASGAVALLAAAATGSIPAEGGFFGAGSLVLVTGLACLRGSLASGLKLRANRLARLAVRNAAHRPGRTVLSAALIATATFLIVSVESFRRDAGSGSDNRKSGTGGYSLMGEAVRPLYHDPGTTAGRQALNLESLDPRTKLEPFRLRPGDDASCLNLYQPKEPRVLGARSSFLHEGRFVFAEAEGSIENPWLLLESERPDGAIPAVVDVNSMTYVLHKKLGDEVTVTGSNGSPVRLRLVASLRDSVMQGELIIAEKHFLDVFKDLQGYRVFLIDTRAADPEKMTGEIENALVDHGMDVVATGEKLAGFHRVENAYLSTFQTLGGLGLLLGTAGLAAILFRNVLERRRELALLAAMGYQRRILAQLILRENVALLVWGLVCGVVAAAVAITPVLATRGAQFSYLSMIALLAGVLLVGITASVLATRASLRGSDWSALRAQ
jgi:ABC-type antimicrobial peptide transport system permease subunit